MGVCLGFGSRNTAQVQNKISKAGFFGGYIVCTSIGLALLFCRVMGFNTVLVFRHFGGFPSKVFCDDGYTVDILEIENASKRKQVVRAVRQTTYNNVSMFKKYHNNRATGLNNFAVLFSY